VTRFATLPFAGRVPVTIRDGKAFLDEPFGPLDYYAAALQDTARSALSGAARKHEDEAKRQDPVYGEWLSKSMTSSQAKRDATAVAKHVRSLLPSMKALLRDAEVKRIIEEVEGRKWKAAVRDNAEVIALAEAMGYLMLPEQGFAKTKFGKQLSSIPAQGRVSVLNGIADALKCFHSGTGAGCPKGKRERREYVLNKLSGLARVTYERAQVFAAQREFFANIPETLMEFLPARLTVALDGAGHIETLEERFAAFTTDTEPFLNPNTGRMGTKQRPFFREGQLGSVQYLSKTHEQKRRTQAAIANNFDSIAATLLRDMAEARSEQARLGASVLYVMYATGARPSQDTGSSAGESTTYGVLSLERDNLLEEGKELGSAVNVEFVGKAGTVNTYNVSGLPALILRVNSRLQEATGSPTLWYDRDSKASFTYADLTRYIRSRPAFELAPGKWLNPTDFRKYRSAEVFYEELRGRKAKLGDDILKIAASTAADDARASIAEAISFALRDALDATADALNHKDKKTTVAAYLNPEILLRFLSTADLDSSLREAVLDQKVSVSFDPEAFIRAAQSWAKGRTANPLHLLAFH